MKDAAVVNNIINAIVKKGGDAVSTAGILEAIGNGTGTITTSFKIESSKEDYSSADAAKELLDKIKVPDGVKLDVKAIQGGVALDISINSEYKLNGKVIVSVEITELGREIKITMDIPEALNNVDKSKGKFYAIRIHGDDVELLPCSKESNNKISFSSDKFSTYVITFVPNKPSEDSNNTRPSGGSYVPTTSATPAPSATAAPSASPSADPSATPGADSSAAPTESGAPTTGGDTTPTKAPAATDKPVDTDKDNTNGGSTAVKVGKKATVSGSQYKVTAVKGTRTVQFTKGKKNAKSIVVPSTVKISGKNYKVTTIAKNAFKGNKKLAKVTIGKNVNKIGVSAFQNCSKLKSIIIKSTKLTAKKVGKNAFKGINKKATFKVPKSKVKAYKKIVKAKGAGKNVKVKK
ncbi:MAG: leucine-rich repeat domain-containing protein [Lachnospiraceae bacterium]